MKKFYIVSIVILENCWNYKNTELIKTLVKSSSLKRAYQKVKNKYCGSEFPHYDIMSVEECDDFIFAPKID